MGRSWRRLGSGPPTDASVELGDRATGEDLGGFRPVECAGTAGVTFSQDGAGLHGGPRTGASSGLGHATGSKTDHVDRPEERLVGLYGGPDKR